tara:strand:- start:261 stop:923 length:663 start_codon:yes stop_codon:yes gene_type:complete
MKKFFLIFFVLIGFQLNSQILSSGSSLTTNVPSATIFINGEIYGQGSVSGIKIAKNDCIQIDVLADGYIPKSAKFCRQKGLPKMKKNEYFELEVDSSFEASFETDFANNDIIINPRGSDLNDIWTSAVRLVVENFDALEVNDNEVRYLRTSWVVNTYEAYTIRTRLIGRVTNENPLELRFKIVSERASGRSSARDDEKFREWDRVLRRYQGLIEEIQSRL